MADTTLPTKEAEALVTKEPVNTQTPATQTTINQAPPLNQIELEDEIEVELIIEDFTIDGICGVY